VAQSEQCLATDRTTGRSTFDRRQRYEFSSSILCVQTGSGAHPASCPTHGGPFPGDKARPGCDADHSPPSSPEVVNDPCTSIGVVGLLFFYNYIKSVSRNCYPIRAPKNCQSCKLNDNNKTYIYLLSTFLRIFFVVDLMIMIIPRTWHLIINVQFSHYCYGMYMRLAQKKA
jgi:hypothetical protein